MSDDRPRPDTSEEMWDRFVDALDRAGRSGAAADVTIPTQLPSALAGKRFGDVTRLELQLLVRIAGQIGRRGDTIATLWEDMHRRANGRHKLQRKSVAPRARKT
jgi:hypothetical protein